MVIKIPGTESVIEKGTPVYISLYGLQRDRKFFYNPDDFNPERFNEDWTIPTAYIPFGPFGPRMCPGK